MIYWDYSIKSQEKIYKAVYEKLKNFDFFQSLNFYVLPHMPQKFRGRVLYLPKPNNSKKLFNKYLRKINLLQGEWKQSETEFIKKFKSYFPKIDNIDIYIEPSLYGTIGSYDTKYGNSIYIYPRYDRKLIDIQKLLINALTTSCLTLKMI